MNSITSFTYIHIIILTLLSCSLLVSCGGDNPSGPDPDPPDDPNVVSEEIGPDGGEITSQDDNLTLTIPEGALSQPETITIGELSEDDLGSEFDEIADALGIAGIYELGPDGLQFDEPVTAAIASDQSVALNDSTLQLSMRRLMFISSEGQGELLDSLRIEPSGDGSGDMQLSGELSHFSTFAVTSTEESGLLTANITGIPQHLQVKNTTGIDVRANVSFVEVDGAEFTPLFIPNDVFLPEGSPIDIPLQLVTPDTGSENFQGTIIYLCDDTGQNPLWGMVRIFLADDQPGDFSDFIEAQQLSVVFGSNDIQNTQCVEEMPEMVTLDLQKDGEGSGTVVSQPEGISCGTDCEQQQADFEEESSVILAAEPADGSVFLGWSGDIPGTCEDSLEPCTITMDGNRTVTATFAPSEDFVPTIHEFGGEFTGPRSLRLELRVEYELDLSILDGTIDPGDGAGPQDVELQETDEENEYQGELEWEYGEDIMYPVMPEADVTVVESGDSDSESFDITQVTLIVEKEGSGSGSVTGELLMANGDSVTETFIDCGAKCDNSTFHNPDRWELFVELVAEADEGSFFAGWSGDTDCSTNECVESIEQDHTITATFETEDTGGSTELATGLVDFNTLELVEGIYSLVNSSSSSGKARFGIANQNQIEETKFGNISGKLPVVFSGSFGFIVKDLLSGEILSEQFAGVGAPALGVMGLTETPRGPDSPATFVLFGLNGVGFYSANFSGGAQTPGGSVFDAFPAGGNTESSYGVYVSSTVLYIELKEGATRHLSLSVFDELFAEPADFDGEVVSAWMPDDGTPGNTPPLVLDRDTDPSNDTESGLYFVPRGDADNAPTPQRLADVGLDARKVRCQDLGGGNFLCAVTVFGDDQVALFNWDGATSLTFTGTVNVGDGPVDMQLRPLQNGNFGLVTTGFNDNTVTVTELSSSGSIISNNTQAAPAGCESPAHAIFLRDAVSLKVVGTCYDSANYFIIESEL